MSGTRAPRGQTNLRPGLNFSLRTPGREHNELYSFFQVSDRPLGLMETRYLYCLCLRRLGSHFGFVTSPGYQRADNNLTWPQELPFRLLRLTRSGEPLARSLLLPDGIVQDAIVAPSLGAVDLLAWLKMLGRARDAITVSARIVLVRNKAIAMQVFLGSEPTIA